jgi:hypothetical protein
MSIINDIGMSCCLNSISVSISYVINDTRHTVLVPTVFVYPMSLMILVMLSWFLQC